MASCRRISSFLVLSLLVLTTLIPTANGPESVSKKDQSGGSLGLHSPVCPRQNHSEKSGEPLVAQEKYPEPKEVEVVEITPSKKELGLAFRANQKKITEALEEKSGEPLVAQEKYPEQKEVEVVEITPSKKELGLAFRTNQMKITQALEKLERLEFDSSKCWNCSDFSAIKAVSFHTLIILGRS